ncbi:alanine/ornithine racemase family PLP-dependent enzyme [Sulfitobacter aestuariivivens]|uniref:Alanine/ornithine racemase family PLP-dependent enzyme n=1 Tax=Sulfitobacter aestuariivivens TaxID=2766981 RepID=A0A927D5P4_9RHOB|nr:alanine/ornithine racemase family PLP-dependent enzyme [Sulfitobacter aestuariivivens]MBD3663717.1 alanine/ornithine racemase family PLP-dependent enzyme [Sulfitobacter aestuariivivens]
MSTPRIEVDISKIRHNTQTVVGPLKARGICVTAVTKAVCGHPAIARAMLDGGASGLAEARLSNVQRLRQAGLTCPVTLIRTPMLSQVDAVVHVCEASYNTEMAVITALAAAALRQNRVHGIILMVEMGDLREGIMPQDLGNMAQQVLDLPGVALKGIGANFACLGGVAPTDAKMRALSDLANEVEGRCGPFSQTVSGGNSANLPWALGEFATGRINDLRLGEAILLGVDPITGDQISGMFQDAFTLVAEVIETDTKPVRPILYSPDHTLARMQLVPDTFDNTRIILGIGHQDIDPVGLSMAPGDRLVGATSDHLVIGTKNASPSVGTEMRFEMNYSALMRAMAAPDTQTNLHNDQPGPNARAVQDPSRHLALV